MARQRRSFGTVRKLPSGRWQARYTGPDDNRYAAPVTFDTRADADAWLAEVRVSVLRGTWTSPDAPAPAVPEALTFTEYADGWLVHRVLKPRTRADYRSLLDKHLLPTFGPMALTAITPADVSRWHTGWGTTTPTLRSRAYGLLRTILGDATGERLIDFNPCHIRGAGNVKRASKTEPATLEELATIVEAMPDRYRPMVLLAAWCGLRFGELAELRRSDIDTRRGVVRVRRGVTRVPREAPIVGTPKSDAGVRDVAIPPHLVPLVKDHLHSHVNGRDGLVFPAASGGHMAPSTLYKVYYPARRAAGRPDLRFHDLRHTGGTLAAQEGATLAELMARLGHSTPGAAMRYQHAAQGRDAEIAARLSERANVGASIKNR